MDRCCAKCAVSWCDEPRIQDGDTLFCQRHEAEWPITEDCYEYLRRVNNEKPKRDKGQITMPEKRTLTCTLTPSELEARGAELARCTFDWEAAEETKKEITKALTQNIKDHESNMKRLARVVKSGKEEREVEVEWRAYPVSETMRLFRLDTEEELTSRPMSREEVEKYRQSSLPLSPPLALPDIRVRVPEAPIMPRQLEDIPEASFEVISE